MIKTIPHLNEAEENFYDLLEAVSLIEDCAIVMLDPEGRVAKWNRGAERIQGYAAEEIVGKYFSVFYSDEDRGAGKSEKDLEAAKKNGDHKDEGWRIRKDGTRFWADVTLAAIHGPRGLKGFAKITRDITGRKKAEMALKKKTDELILLHRDLEQFAYIASHDLQEPLRKILNYSELTQFAVSEEKRQEYIERLRKATFRMKTLVEGLLEFSRADQPGDFKEVDLKGIVAEVVAHLEVNKEAEVNIGEIPAVRGDAVLLRQLFQNLIANSLKFRSTKKTCHVHIYGRAENGYHEVVVEDNGIGFDMKYADKLFKAFQRLHSQDEYHGTGIGLAICHKIMQRHGGTITAKSEVDKGSAFSLRFPETTAETALENGRPRS